MARGVPVAVLWELALDGNRLSCAVRRQGPSFELTVSSPTAVILAQEFELGPRAIARAKALREGLRRRGWREPDGPKPESRQRD